VSIQAASILFACHSFLLARLSNYLRSRSFFRGRYINGIDIRNKKT